MNGIIEAQRRWEDSLNNLDLPSMRSLLDEDDVQTDYRGVVQDRASWLRDFEAAVSNVRSGAVTYAFAFDDETVRDFGQTGLVRGRLRITQEGKEAPVEQLVRFTNVWVMRSGDWKLVSYQATPVQ